MEFEQTSPPNRDRVNNDFHHPNTVRHIQTETEMYQEQEQQAEQKWTDHQPPLQPEHPAQPTTNPRIWLPPDDTTPSQPNIRISPTKVKPSSPTHAVQLNGNSGQEGHNRHGVIQRRKDQQVKQVKPYKPYNMTRIQYLIIHLILISILYKWQLKSSEPCHSSISPQKKNQFLLFLDYFMQFVNWNKIPRRHKNKTMYNNVYSV